MPHASVTRTEREFNEGWAKANQALFVNYVFSFQAEAPIEEWQHFVDLSRPGFMKLIAVRRAKPFKDRAEYLADGRVDGGTYLKEIGYDR